MPSLLPSAAAIVCVQDVSSNLLHTTKDILLRPNINVACEVLLPIQVLSRTAEAGDGEDNYDNLVESMMMAWTGAGGAAKPAAAQSRGQEGASTTEAQASRHQQIYSLPGSALLTKQEKDWARFEVSFGFFWSVNAMMQMSLVHPVLAFR